MPFIRIKGFNGLVFTPDPGPVIRKNPVCTDCMSCRFCSNEKCHACLKKPSGGAGPAEDGKPE